MFRCDCWLVTAHEALESIINDKPLNAKDKKMLKWTGSLLAHMDYDDPAKPKKCVEPMTTTIRPIFWQSLIDLLRNDSEYQTRFPRNNTDSIASYKDFSHRVCQTLYSGFEKNTLSKEEIRMTAKLVHRMSEYIFSNLQNSRGHQYEGLAS